MKELRWVALLVEKRDACSSSVGKRERKCELKDVIGIDGRTVHLN
jgi:hypothetical protein